MLSSDSCPHPSALPHPPALTVLCKPWEIALSQAWARSAHWCQQSKRMLLPQPLPEASVQSGEGTGQLQRQWRCVQAAGELNKASAVTRITGNQTLLRASYRITVRAKMPPVCRGGCLWVSHRSTALRIMLASHPMKALERGLGTTKVGWGRKGKDQELGKVLLFIYFKTTSTGFVLFLSLLLVPPSPSASPSNTLRIDLCFKAQTLISGSLFISLRIYPMGYIWVCHFSSWLRVGPVHMLSSGLAGEAHRRGWAWVSVALWRPPQAGCLLKALHIIAFEAVPFLWGPFCNIAFLWLVGLDESFISFSLSKKFPCCRMWKERISLEDVCRPQEIRKKRIWSALILET